MSRLAKYERLVRRLRQRIWDYDGTPKEAQAARILTRAIAIQSRLSPSVMSTDQWGATIEDRRILESHGICWGD